MDVNRALAFASALVLVSACSLDAHADADPHKRDSADAVARAERLFNDAKKLVREGKHAEACVKLEESERLDSALGTQFNLADCYEHTGRPARAWNLFTRVAASAKAAGRSERERAAVERAAALDPKVARITVSVKVRAPGLEVRRDGVVSSPESHGRPEVVEPGPVSIVASAPGHEDFSMKVVLVAGEARTIEIPELAPLPPPAPPPPPTPAPEESPGLRGQEMAAIGVGVVGVVGLGIGGAFGIVSLTKHDEAKAVCPEPTACHDPDAAETWTDATTAGNIATIAIVAGIVAVGAAGALWFTTPKTRTVASRPLGDFVLRW